MPFSPFNLSSPLQRAISESGYTQPTPIQEKVIPLVVGTT
jgi:ATP-dependent RNA helicase RhlE